jgi:hypothetical protein
MQRGYLPSMTYSSHYIRDPQLRYAVAKFLDKERDDIEYTLQVGRRAAAGLGMRTCRAGWGGGGRAGGRCWLAAAPVV